METSRGCSLQGNLVYINMDNTRFLWSPGEGAHATVRGSNRSKGLSGPHCNTAMYSFSIVHATLNCRLPVSFWSQFNISHIDLIWLRDSRVTIARTRPVWAVNLRWATSCWWQCCAVVSKIQRGQKRPCVPCCVPASVTNHIPMHTRPPKIARSPTWTFM